MALHHVLFRCPGCGQDPLTGEGDSAQCSSCGRVYVRRKAGRVIQVAHGDTRTEALIADLMQSIEAHGGALTAAEGPDGRIRYEARALLREGDQEEAVRFRGQVLGFVEQLGEGGPGTLSLDEDALRFVPDGGAAPRTWTLLGVRAVQSSSSAIQISPKEGGVVLFRFEADSPVRWESLVKRAIQRAYDRAGRGTIQEFQPRIVSG